MHTAPIHVALSLVSRDGLWLVAQRPAHVHLGGFWEFPGGKVHENESTAAAALRELREECDVIADAIAELPAQTHSYDDRTIRLSPIVCSWQSGEARPLASVACEWVDLAQLRQLRMPKVNAAIIASLETAIIQREIPTFRNLPASRPPT